MVQTPSTHAKLAQIKGEPCYKTLKTTPYVYQCETVDKLIELKMRGWVCLEQGLGKCIISIMCALRRPNARPVVVVCAASLKWNWRNELIHHAGLRSEILEGKTALRSRMRRRANIWIVNYDILTEWLPLLRELDPQLIVIDESQMAKNRKAQRTKAVRQLCKGVKHILALSGTPMLNRPVELYPIANLLWPDAFPSYARYARRYCGRKKDDFGQWDDTGATRLPELHRKLKRLGMIRIRKRDVLDLPPKTEKIVLVDIKDPNGEYDRAKGKYLSWLKDFRNIVRMDRNQQRGHLNTLKGIVGRLKLPSVYKWLDRFLEKHLEDKIIVFGWHREIVEAIQKRYDDVSVMVHGGILGKKRQSLFEQFSRDPRVRILSGNIQAAGVGWPGQAANHVAFVEFPWEPGSLLQAAARPDRIGQTKPISCYYITARSTIDETLIRILERKAKILAATLDGKKRKEDFSVYELVTEALKKEGR